MTRISTESPKLLPCPFCGDDEPVFVRRGTSQVSCIVECGNCGGRHESSDQYERSGTSWNRRAQQAQPVAATPQPFTARQRENLFMAKPANVAKRVSLTEWHRIVQYVEATTGSPDRKGEAMRQKVLDPCCGSRMMWLDKADPRVIFGDCRSETIVVTDRSHREDGTRTLRIEPDAVMDFRALPFPDGHFRLVAFDPPHLVRAGPRSWLAAKYGKLGQDWRNDLRAGFSECFRVLEPHGVLIFKWNETHIRVAEVLSLTPNKPLFGHLSGRRSLTHWCVFMKDATDAVGTSSSTVRARTTS